jgi:hypothetical protein
MIVWAWGNRCLHHLFWLGLQQIILSNFAIIIQEISSIQLPWVKKASHPSNIVPWVYEVLFHLGWRRQFWLKSGIA